MGARESAAARILVTGATGNTGRPITAQLAASGFAVRTATPSADAPRLGLASTTHVRFDWKDAPTHAEALRDIDRMYLLAPGLVEDPAAVMIPFIERALEQGVRRVVMLSSSAVPEGASGLGAVHRFIRERAPEWAVLQPSWFMQNFIDARHHHGGSLRRRHTMLTSAGSGRVGFVDAADIAAVAVRALADEASHDRAHVITGPEALSYDDIARTLSEALGHPVRHVHVSPEEATRDMMAAGIPEPYARLLIQLEERIRRGDEAGITDTVERVTGRAPRSFMDFLRATLIPAVEDHVPDARSDATPAT
jgi:uncharacterized protein YbjT (DUF2867 family)